jgi:hypothetical protein
MTGKGCSSRFGSTIINKLVDSGKPRNKTSSVCKMYEIPCNYTRKQVIEENTNFTYLPSQVVNGQHFQEGTSKTILNTDVTMFK